MPGYMQYLRTVYRQIPVEVYPVVVVVGLACGLAGYRGMRMYNELENPRDQFEHARFKPQAEKKSEQ